MGIEFYGLFQARVDDQWKDVGRYDDFYGNVLQHWIAPWDDLHAGWDIEPIAPWRGAPPGFEKEYPELMCLLALNGCQISWLSVQEILDALPVLEVWQEALDEAELLKRSAQGYWDAHWIKHAPRLVASRRLGSADVEDSSRVVAEFIIDRSAEVQDFIDQASALLQQFGDVRFVFHYETDW